MTKRTLIVVGHHNPDSYTNALATAYARGAEAVGAEVRRLNLYEMDFDPVARPDSLSSSSSTQPLEPDLQRAQRDLEWAEHVVFAYPKWWGGMPALMKGFIDRVLQEGYAYEYGPSREWIPRLEGRSAHLLITVGVPQPQNGLPPGDLSVKGALESIGITPVRVTHYGPISKPADPCYDGWLQEAHGQGELLM